MSQGNFNKYRVKENTDKPQVLADPILKFFNGGFLMPAKNGGMLAYPNNNNQSGYLPPRMKTGGWLKKYADGGFATTETTTIAPFQLTPMHRKGWEAYRTYLDKKGLYGDERLNHALGKSTFNSWAKANPQYNLNWETLPYIGEDLQRQKQQMLNAEKKGNFEYFEDGKKVPVAQANPTIQTNLQSKNTWWPGTEFTSQGYTDFEEELQKNGKTVESVQHGIISPDSSLEANLKNFKTLNAQNTQPKYSPGGVTVQTTIKPFKSKLPPLNFGLTGSVKGNPMWKDGKLNPWAGMTGITGGNGGLSVTQPIVTENKVNPNDYVSLKNNKDWFDNHANWTNTGNAKWDSKVRDLVLTGRFGLDPKSGALIKLPENEWSNVSDEDKRLATDKRQWTTAQKQTSWENQVKPQIVQSTKDLITNPVMMAPGVILTGGMLAGLPAVSETLAAVAPALETSIGGVPGLTAGNLLNAGFAYQGAKNLPNVASAWKDVSNKPTWGGLGNAVSETALTGLDMLPFAGSAFKGLPSVIGDVKQAGSWLNKGYTNVATGNSALPFAWKSPAVGLSEEASQNMFKNVLNNANLTDAERAVVADYQHNSRLFTGRNGNIDPVKRQAMNDIVKKYNINVGDDAIATRMFNPNNKSLGATLENGRLNFGDRPTSFTVGAKGSYGSGATDRIVIPNRWLKNMEGNFVKNTYEPLSEDALKLVPENLKNWAAGIGRDGSRLGQERELIGSGLDFKRIGKVKNDVGGYDWIVKPKTNNKFGSLSLNNKADEGIVSGNYLKSEYTVPEDIKESMIKSTNTITGKGRELLNDVASPEGIKRLKNQFKLADPSLTEDQLSHLVATRLSEASDALQYNKPRFWLTHGQGAPGTLSQNIPIESLLPTNNAHFVGSNPWPHVGSVKAPESLFPRVANNTKGLNLGKKSGIELFVDPDFNPGTITLGRNFEENPYTLSHEFGHALQGKGSMPIDQQLIDLWKGKKNPIETFLDRWHYRRLSPESKKDLKYFLNSDSRSVKSEPYAFLREQREKMLDRGILGETYDKITPFKMWQARRAAAGNTLGNFAEGDRIAKFLPWWKYNRFSKIANTAPAVIPAIGGAGLLLNQDGTPQQAYGGPIGSIYGYRNYDNDMLTNKANGGDISIPDLDTSNWLKKYKVGGPGPKESDLSKAVEKGKTFNEQWMNSPMYKQMLETSMGVNKNPFVFNQNRTDADRMNRTRKFQLKNSKWGVGPKDISSSDSTAAEAYAWKPWGVPLAGSPINYVDENSKYPDAIPYVNFVKGVAGQGGDDLASDAVHEFSHISDASSILMPDSDKKLITKYSDNSPKYAELERKFGKEFADHEREVDNTKWFNYIKDPTETRARLNDFRMRAKDQGLYDPFTQRFDIKYFKKYKTLNDGSFDPISQLRDVYTDEEIADMLNKISKSDNGQPQTMAKYGGASTGWLGKYETGSEVTDTTTIKPGWSLMSAVPEWHVNGTTTIQKPVVKKVTETPKKLPQKSYVGKPATQEEWANSNNNVNTQVTATGAYRLPTDAEWENVQRKKGININTGRTIAPGWNLGGGDKIAVTQPSLTEAQKFQFENPYTTPNPNLDDSDPRTPDYWWSKAGWNPEKQQTPEGVAAFARLYPQFATADSDREWTTLPDGRSAWKKRVHPWQIPGTPQYKALTEINELETEKNNLIAKTVVQLADPTGVTMWGDTWDSYKELYNHPSVWNATLAGVNTIASLPFVKYFGEEAMIPVKGAETATKVANITSKLEKLYTKYPELSKLQKAMNVGEKVVGAGKKSLNYLNNSAAGKLVHYVGGEPFMKTFDKATGAEKLFKLPTTGAIQGFNKMERFGKASINLPLNLYANNQNIKDLKNSLNSGGLFYNFQRPNGTTFQISKEIQDKQLPGSIPFDAIDANYDGKNEIIPIYDDKTLNSMDIYIPAMYNNSQKTQPKLKKLPNKK